jgi:uncharacterized membrane protein HdeD (DUF308 family)
MKLLNKTREKLTALAVCIKNPTHRQMQTALLMLGVVILSVGLTDIASAAPEYSEDNVQSFKDIIGVIFCFLEGAFGALIMVIAGIGAIVAASFGNYKASLTLLIVAIGSFVLKGIVKTFFPDMVEDACG